MITFICIFLFKKGALKLQYGWATDGSAQLSCGWPGEASADWPLTWRGGPDTDGRRGLREAPRRGPRKLSAPLQTQEVLRAEGKYLISGYRHVFSSFYFNSSHACTTPLMYRKFKYLPWPAVVWGVIVFVTVHSYYIPYYRLLYFIGQQKVLILGKCR